jgi:hypothetical protein
MNKDKGKKYKGKKDKGKKDKKKKDELQGIMDGKVKRTTGAF